MKHDCAGISQCKYCPAKFRKGIKLPEKDYDHRCTDYIVRLIEEIVGPKAFQVAKDSLNRRMTNREKLLTEGKPEILNLKKDGSLERLMQAESDALEKRF